MFLELLKGRFKNIKRLSQRWRLFSLFSYDKYKSFWEPYNKKLESSKKYDKLSTKEIDSEIADLNLSDYDYKSVNSNIRKYTNSIEYFENIISVKPDEKNQKYKRNYYFTDGGLNYAYIYDPDNTDDWYKLYYDDDVLYCYKTPDKTYKYSDITLQSGDVLHMRKPLIYIMIIFMIVMMTMTMKITMMTMMNTKMKIISFQQVIQNISLEVM